MEANITRCTMLARMLLLFTSNVQPPIWGPGSNGTANRLKPLLMAPARATVEGFIPG